MAVLESISMTMKTKSFPFLVEGSPDISSMEMDSQGRIGVGRGVYRP